MMFVNVFLNTLLDSPTDISPRTTLPLFRTEHLRHRHTLTFSELSLVQLFIL
jgi:hypothetical protein